MVHLFLFDYGRGEYYRIGIEGNIEEAEQFLKSVSRDVRYIGTKNKTKNDIGNRKIGEDLYVRSCSFAYELRALAEGNKNQVPVDQRHRVLDNG